MDPEHAVHARVYERSPTTLTTSECSFSSMLEAFDRRNQTLPFGTDFYFLSVFSE